MIRAEFLGSWRERARQVKAERRGKRKRMPNQATKGADKGEATKFSTKWRTKWAPPLAGSQLKHIYRFRLTVIGSDRLERAPEEFRAVHVLPEEIEGCDE